MPVDHPPKPHLTLRVGITGHRPNKLGIAAAPRIAAQLRAVFDAVDAAAAAIYRDNSAFYAAAGERTYTVRLISGFAEGADQIAVAACPPSWTIEAILPFPRDEYLKDFAQSAAGDGRDVRSEFLASLARASAVTELPARPEDRDHAYVIAGNFLLQQIDLLIAVWDGEPPKRGGTGAIAQEARQGGIPVVWVATQKDCEPVIIDRFDDDTPVVTAQDWSEALTKTELPPLFAAPSSSHRHGSRRSPRAALEAFYAEIWRPVSRMPFYDMLKRGTNRQPLQLRIRTRAFADTAVRFDRFVDAAPPAPSLHARLKQVLTPRYVWADSLAVHFSHLYRSAYVLSYTLSALAVWIALVGIFVESTAVKAALVTFELAVISCIIWIVRHGRGGAWHERWLDYRTVAENLRHGNFLSFVGEFGGIHQQPPAGGREPPWALWYIRATLREIGIPNATLNDAYQQPLLAATLKYEVDAQIEYHHGTAEAMHNLDRFLHGLAEACFHLTLWLLIAFLAVYGIYLVFSADPIEASLSHFFNGTDIEIWLEQGIKIAKQVVVAFAAGLPALGAALAGIRVQGDFESAKERSERMVDELTALKAEYERTIARNAQLDHTASMLIDTARMMSEDLAAWQDLYGRKRLTLPA
ncbi:MAG: hypothetical protein ACRECO_00850 [Xanthobacteraceae bacterium]